MTMGPVAITILALALAGAAASWVVGAISYARCLAGIAGEGGGAWPILRALVAWPFAMQKLKGAGAEQAATVNKAIVAFFVCLTVAGATISLSTNYNRISR